MLVDDGQVESEKIGSALFYWSFPSKNAQSMTQRATELKDSIETELLEMEKTRAQLDSAAALRPESETRSMKLQKLTDLKAEVASLENQVELLKENDPVEIEKMEKNITMCREATNRWTDNLLELRTWMVKKKGMSMKEAKDTLKQMGVPSELEHVV
jgi:hypothetical protein